MTEKQKRFCDEYLIDMNATQAAIRAGYSEKTACSIANENLRKPEISAYIDAQVARMHSSRIADAEEIMEFLTSVVRGEKTEQTLQLCGNGFQKIVDIDIGGRDRLKAAELIGKRYGLFVDKTDLNIERPIVISGGDQLED